MSKIDDKETIGPEKSADVRLSSQSRERRTRIHSGISSSTEKKSFTIRHSDGMKLNRSIIQRTDALHDISQIRDDKKLEEKHPEPLNGSILQELQSSFQKVE